MKNLTKILLVFFLLFALTNNSSAQTGPGGVATGLRLWLKADAGTSTTTSGSTVTDWNDQSGNALHTTQGAAGGPSYSTNSGNYNPGLVFTNNLLYRAAPGVFATGTAYANLNYYAVYNDDDVANFDWIVYQGSIGFDRFSHSMNYLGAASADMDPTTTNRLSYTNSVTGRPQIVSMLNSTTAISGTNKRLLYLDGNLIASNTAYTSYTGVNYPFQIGDNDLNAGDANNNPFTGKLHEIILYTGANTIAQRQQIESYLAIKYGVLLERVNASGKYVNSSGTTTYSDGGVATYWNDIMGIGRDDNSALLQKQSHELDDSTRIYLSTLQASNSANTGTFSSNNQFVLMGHNNLSLTNTGSVEYPGGYGVLGRVNREWKITNTAFTGTYSIDIKLPGSICAVDPSTFKLLVDNDGNFTDASVLDASSGLTFSYSSGVLTVGNISTSIIPANSTKYITLTINPASVGGTAASNQIVCTGNSPANITLSGNTGSIVKWQYSTDNFVSSINDIASSAATPLTSAQMGTITANRYYRAVVQNGVCTSANSSTVTMTISALSYAGSTNTAQSICTGNSPANISVGGNVGGVTKWQYSTDNFSSSIVDIGASANPTLTSAQMGTLTANRYYRGVVQNNTCPVAYSPALLITVNPVIATNTISAAQAICTSTAPTALTGSTPTGGSGTYTYLWESSTTSAVAGFATASGTSNGQNYTPGILTQNTWYRRTVSSGGCTDVSTAIAITVNPVIGSNTISAAQAICTSTAPAALTGSSPSGGNGSYTYLWESSTTSAVAGFGTASGTSNGTNYTPGVLTQNTWYRRTVTSGGCSNTSAVIAITVSPVIATNTISAAQAICSGTTPVGLTGSTPTGGNGAYTYLWESSTTSAVAGFGTASGTSNGQNYTPGSLTQNTWYRRTVSSGGCSDVSAAIQITITAVITTNTISAAQSICTGTTPSGLTGSTATGGNGAYVYLWESSTTSAVAGFATASGTSNGTNYTPGVLTQTTWYRRTVTSGSCTNTTAAIQITVNTLIANNTVSAAQSICTSTTPTGLTGTLPTGGSGAYIYLWESSTTSAVTGFGTASGTSNGQNYTPGSLTQTTWYRRTVTSGGCTDVATAIQITVNPVIASNTVSSAQNVCNGSAPAGLTGTTPTGGSGSYTYLWESSTTSAVAGFGTASGTSSGIDYTPGTITQTTWYRRTVTSGGCTNTATAIQMTIVAAPVASATATPSAFCLGQSTSLTSTGSSSILNTSPTFSNNTSGAIPDNSATGVSRTIAVSGLPTSLSAVSKISVTVNVAHNTDQDIELYLVRPGGNLTTTTNGTYRNTTTTGESIVLVADRGANGNNFTSTVFSDDAVTAISAGSSPFTNNYRPETALSTLTGDPNGTWTLKAVDDAAGTSGTLTNWTISFEYYNGVTYSWSSAPAGFSSSVEDPGTVSPIVNTTYTVTVTDAVNGCYTQASAATTVYAVIANNTVSAAQSICTSTTPAGLTGTTPTGGSGAYTYLWESSTTSAVAGFSTASGTSNGQNYTPGSLTQTTWYRRTVTSGGCSNPSTAIQITVNPVIANNTVSSAQNVCNGSAPAGLTGTTPTGGSGSYTYVWESSTISAVAGFSTASGTSNGINYTPGIITQNTWYRRMVTSGGCTNISAAIQMTIVAAPSASASATVSTFCAGDSTSLSSTGSSPILNTPSFSNNTSGAIPDNSATGVSRTIAVSGLPTSLSAVSKISVTVNVAHNTDQDIELYLVRPGGNLTTTTNGSYRNTTTTGESIVLVADRGVNGNNFTSTVFSDDAATAISAGSSPFTGNYRPESLLSSLTGDPNGSWTLKAVDDAAGTTGTLTNWSISFEYYNGVTYSWTSSPAGFTSSSQNPGKVAPAVSTTYTVTVSDAVTGCSTQASTAVTVNPKPVITISPNYCIGGDVVRLTCNTMSSYLWSTGSTAQYVDVDIAGTYIVTGTNSNGCSDTASYALSQELVNNGTFSAGNTGFTTLYVNNQAANGLQPEGTYAISNNAHDNHTYFFGTDHTTGSGNFMVVNGSSATQTIWQQTIAIVPNTTYYFSAWAMSVNDVPPYAELQFDINGTQVGSVATLTAGANSTSGPFNWVRFYGTWNSGASTSALLSIVDLQTAPNGNDFGLDDISFSTLSPVSLTAAPSANGDTAICAGNTLNLTANISGGIYPLVYSWTGPNSFTSSSLNPTISNITAAGAGKYYLNITDVYGCSHYDSTLALVVSPVLANNTISAAQAICTSTTPTGLTGSTPTGGNGTYTYLWESSTTSAVAGFGTASGTSNGINYTPGVLTQTTWYRRTVTSGGCSNTSAVIAITVSPVIATNTISAAQAICTSTTPTGLTGSTPTGGNGTYTYLWESSTTSAVAGFGTASGTSNGINYTPGVLTQNTWYRRTVTSGGCSDVSAVIAITVSPVIATNTISAAQAICTSTTPTGLTGSTPTGGNGTYTYLWESSTTSAVAGFGTVSGTSNGINYTPGVLTQNTWFRRTVTSGGCSNTSAVIAITVSPVIATNTISAAQAICTSTTPTGLTGSTPTGGNGTYTYLWESSTTSAVAGFGTASGTSNGINYTPGVLTQNTWYRRTVTSGGCSNTSAVIAITVSPVIATNTISAAQAICTSTTPTGLTGSTPTGGNGTYTYLWESSTTSAVAGFGTASGTSNGINYTPGVLTQTTWYRRTVTSGGCSNTATTIQILVSTPPTLTGSAAPQVCNGNGATVTLTGMVPNSLNNTISYGINGVAQLPVTGVNADPSGVASFTTTTLTTANNGQTLRINSITSGGCSQAFGQTMTLSVVVSGTWFGINNNWSDPLNWCGGIPTTATDVLIPSGLSNYPYVNAGTGTVRNLVVQPNASLTLAGTGKMQISGTITNNGSIDATDGSIEMNGASGQSVSGTMFVSKTIRNFIVSNTHASGVTVSSTDTLKIKGELAFGYDNAKLTTGDKVVLLSSATGTARIGEIAENVDGTPKATISGKIIIERYYPAKRAWRLITAPIKNDAATPTINEAWQEGASPSVTGVSNANPHPPYGTHITGPYNASHAFDPLVTSSGFDQSPQNNSSIKFSSGSINALSPVTNTLTSKVTDKQAYLIFVRGNRSYSISSTTNFTTASEAILRTVGNPNTGMVSIPVDTGFQLIGNPYPSAINLNDALFTENSGVMKSSNYQVWDPLKGSAKATPSNVGGWIPVAYMGSGTYISTYDPSQNVPGLESSHAFDINGQIQSGAAFIIDNKPTATGSFVLHETCKMTGSNNYQFRPMDNPLPILRSNLYYLEASGAPSYWADGAVNVFGDQHSSDLDWTDVRKVISSGENLAIRRAGELVSIEARKPISAVADTIFLDLNKVKLGNYRFDFITANLNRPGVDGYIEDSYTNVRTPLNMDGTTSLTFTISNVAGSYKNTRFRIVFGPTWHTVPVTYASVKAWQQNKDIAVEWKVENELNIKEYEVEKSTDGVHFTKVNTTNAKGNNNSSVNYNWLDVNAVAGINYYRIRSIDNANAIKYSQVVKVTISKANGSITIYPNPVKNNVTGLQFTNMPAGRYTIRIVNTIGQVMMTKVTMHPGGSATETIQWNEGWAHGIYNVEIINPDNAKSVIKLINQ